MSSLSMYALVTLAAGCAEPADRSSPLVFAEDAIEALEVIRHIPFTASDTLAIVRVADLIATTSGYAVADAGGQVLLLDEGLALRHRFGSEGSGPSELRLPLDLEPLPDGGVAIYDSGNHRITLIDGEGRLVRTVPPAGGPPTDFAVLADGSLVVSRFEGERGLARYADAGGEGFGHLPAEAAGSGDDPGAAVLRSVNALLTSGSDGAVHHYDIEQQRLYTYARDGSLAAFRRLPDRTLELLAASREEARAAFGEDRVLGFSPVLGLGRVGPHPVLVAPALPSVAGVGLVLDRTGALATPVVAGPGVRAADFRRITSFALRGEVLTAATDLGLYQYRVRYPSHLASLAYAASITTGPPAAGPDRRATP